MRTAEMKLRLPCIFLAMSAMQHPLFAADSKSTGSHFRVQCHFKNDAIAADVLETAEDAWAAAQKLFGLSDDSASGPIAVHLYPDVESYREAEEKLIGGEFRNAPAFVHHDGRSIHVSMQPPLSKRLMKAVGLAAMTRRCVAREVTDLERSLAMPNFKAHPGWLSEGAAEYIVERVMRSNKWSPSSSGDPYFSTYMAQVKHMLEHQRLPPMSGLFQDAVQSLKAGERVGLRWCLFRFLRSRENAPNLEKVIAEAGRLEPGDAYLQDLYVFADQTFGSDGFAQLDQKFREYVGGMKPTWEEEWRSLEVRSKQWIQIAYPETNAAAWRAEPAGSNRFTIEGELKILPGKVEQMNVLLARDPNGFVSVAFAGNGAAGVLLFNGKNKNWETLVSGKSNMLRAGKKTRFQVKVDGTRVHVFVGKRLVTKVELKGQDFSGPWGLGAQADSAGIWYGVKVVK